MSPKELLAKMNNIPIVIGLALGLPLLLMIIASSTSSWLFFDMAMMMGGGMMGGPMMGGPIMGPMQFGFPNMYPNFDRSVEVGLFFTCSRGGLGFEMCQSGVMNNMGMMRCFGWCEKYEAAQGLAIVSMILLVVAVLAYMVGGMRDIPAASLAGAGMATAAGMYHIFLFSLIIIGNSESNFITSGILIFVVAGIFFDIKWRNLEYGFGNFNREVNFGFGMGMPWLPGQWWFVGYGLGLCIVAGFLTLILAIGGFVVSMRQNTQKRERVPDDEHN